VKRYNERVHSDIGEPRARWLRGAERVAYVDEDLLQDAFRFRVTHATRKSQILRTRPVYAFQALLDGGNAGL
jgi:hypothetical protein